MHSRTKARAFAPSTLEGTHALAAETVLTGVAVLLAVGALFDLTTFSGSLRLWMLAMSTLDLGFCLLLRRAWRRPEGLGPISDATWFAFGLLLASSSFFHLAVTRNLACGAELVLILATGGFLFRNLRVLVAFLAALAAAWIGVAASIGHLSDLRSQVFGIIAGAVCALALFAARAREHARISFLRAQDRRRGERVRAALVLARRTLQQRKRDESEKELLRAALLQAQKMEAVGRLAGGVAHDINNVLATIQSAAELLSSDSNLDAAGRDDVATILGAAHTGADFTRNLLAVGRRGKAASTGVDPSGLLGTVQRAVLSYLPVEVALEVHLEHGEARLEGDADQLMQALVNVCRNAIEAMPDGGTLSLRSNLVTLDGVEAHKRAIVPGAYVALSVSDSGEGMGSSQRLLAFEPFYSTKPAHTGAGLGLPMAYGTARGHGGSAEIESSRGSGTVVTLFLPIEEERGPVQESSAPEGDPRNVAPFEPTLLLVDDEGSVRAVARRILERLGVRVTEAANGRRALSAFAGEGPFDLVVVDMAMPIMGGAELFRRIKIISPAVRVVLVAGPGQVRDALRLVELGALAIVEKPYTAVALGRAVQAALRPTRAAARVKRA